MCGRFGIATDLEALQDFFVFDPASVEYLKRYNVAPTDPVLTYGAQGANTAEYMRWGLIPNWSKPGGRKLPLAINARAETLATNGMFKEPFARRRCLVIADGFYEWRKNEDGSTTPFRFGMTNWEPFGFAGVWDEWLGPDGPMHSCTIVTTTPNEMVEHVHDRMPVILPRDAYGEWLDRDAHDTRGLSELLRPYPADGMEMYEISSAIGSVKNDTPSLLDPVSQGKLL
ncbi:MAG: SOS response-associated peptidase [Chloroflexi bacterium]|nr:SOS response-associated peptidase [Chloroflexota bacterium]